MKRKSNFCIFIVLSILLCTTHLIFNTGCSSGQARSKLFKDIENSLDQRDYQTAISKITAAKDDYYSARDRVLYYIDLGMLYHYSGDFEKSNEYLTEAEYAIEELFTRSVSRAATSLLLNDNVLEYTGEDYEDIYTNIIKAINFLNLEQFDNAFVEIRRINDKLNILEDKYKELADSFQQSEEAEIEFETGTNEYYNSVLGRYLSLLIYRTEGRLDAAKIDYNSIVEGWRGQSHIYNFPKPDISSHLNITNNAKLNIIALVGKPPVKKPFERRISTYEGYLIVSGNEPCEFVHTIYWPGLSKDYHFKFSLPFMERRDTEVERVRVVVDERIVGELDFLEDLGNIAIETFAVKAPVIYFRSVVRSLVKGIAAERAKSEMKSRTNPLVGALLGISTDIAVDLSEQADTRASRFLPGKTMVGEIDLEPGIYNIRIEYLNQYGQILFRDEFPQKQVRKGELNLVNTFYLN